MCDKFIQYQLQNHRGIKIKQTMNIPIQKKTFSYYAYDPQNILNKYPKQILSQEICVRGNYQQDKYPLRRQRNHFLDIQKVEREPTEIFNLIPNHLTLYVYEYSQNSQFTFPDLAKTAPPPHCSIYTESTFYYRQTIIQSSKKCYCNNKQKVPMPLLLVFSMLKQGSRSRIILSKKFARQIPAFKKYFESEHQKNQKQLTEVVPSESWQKEIMHKEQEQESVQGQQQDQNQQQKHTIQLKITKILHKYEYKNKKNDEQNLAYLTQTYKNITNLCKEGDQAFELNDMEISLKKYHKAIQEVFCQQRNKQTALRQKNLENKIFGLKSTGNNSNFKYKNYLLDLNYNYHSRIDQQKQKSLNHQGDASQYLSQQQKTKEIQYFQKQLNLLKEMQNICQTISVKAIELALICQEYTKTILWSKLLFGCPGWENDIRTLMAKARAFVGLRKWKYAKETFQKVLLLQPHNLEAQKQLQQVNLQIQKNQSQEKKSKNNKNNNSSDYIDLLISKEKQMYKTLHQKKTGVKK